MVHLKDEENIQLKRKIQILKNEMAKIDPDSNLSKIAELKKELQTILDINEKLANEVDIVKLLYVQRVGQFVAKLVTRVGINLQTRHRYQVGVSASDVQDRSRYVQSKLIDEADVETICRQRLARQECQFLLDNADLTGEGYPECVQTDDDKVQLRNISERRSTG